MYAGRVACCFLVNLGKFAYETDRQTDERQTVRYITLFAGCGPV